MFFKHVKNIAAVILAVNLIATVVPAAADNQQDVSATKKVSASSEDEYYFEQYETYLEQFEVQNTGSKITLTGENTAELNCERLKEYGGAENVLKLSKAGESVSWNFSVEKADFYEIYLTYAPFNAYGTDLTVSVMFDGKAAYSALENVVIPRFWENSTNDFEVDKDGNHITPEQVLVKTFNTWALKDNAGVVLEPYKVYLEAGTHSFTVKVGEEPIVLKSVELSAYDTVKSYSEVYDSSKKTDASAETIYIEAEKANIKTSNSIVPKSDSSANLTPTSPVYDYLNSIGGATWGSAGDTLYWNFDVKASGYYKLAFNYKQSDVINGESFRWIKIDGKTPFKEMENVKFSYSNKWKYTEFKNENNEPYYIWLDKGTHTFSMEVTISYISDYYKRLQKTVDMLSETYMDIVMITGDSPDVNRDYELFNQIPGLNNTLSVIYDDLKSLADDIQKSSGQRSNQYVAAFNNMARVCKNMIDSPYLAHQYVKNYYTNYCTVSSWLYDMKDMPVKLDQIQLVPSTKDYPGESVDFFGSLGFGVKRFLASFADKYAKSYDESGEALEIWVNWGIDQTKALTTLISESFTKQSGIPVNVRITNASLVKGILSGNYPDMALHMTRTEPVNLGIRGALYDLSRFDDYEDVLSRFQSTASTPYTYNGKAYALPDTQAFYVMFYRTDILKELELSVPKTWDEFIRAATIIQRKNMQIYIPYTQITSTTTVNTGIGGLSLYPTLMAQKRVSIYNDEKNACRINTPEAVSVFKFWTQLYTDYKYLKEADFYNRFRVGSMPLGIATYGTYMTLTDAAPEIKGKWSIACVPGMADGSNAVAGSGTGCAIVAKSSHKKEAWEFLKWWTSADTQLSYSNNVESMLGTVGRQHTSNVEAFSNMPWDKATRSTLLEQWSRVEEVPEIPGSYYLTRAVDQAYWAVLNNNENYQSTMDKWNEIANGEISRKIAEYE